MTKIYSKLTKFALINFKTLAFSISLCWWRQHGSCWRRLQMTIRSEFWNSATAQYVLLWKGILMSQWDYYLSAETCHQWSYVWACRGGKRPRTGRCPCRKNRWLPGWLPTNVGVCPWWSHLHFFSMTWTTDGYKMAGLKGGNEVAMMGADKSRCLAPDWISCQTGLQVQAGKR